MTTDQATPDDLPPAARHAGFTSIREALLHAMDTPYVRCAIGYDSPEELLAAYDASRTPPAAELAQRLGAIRQQMANAATDRPTPQQLADWDEFDRSMAARIQKARPGIPLHHAYATLQTLRAIQQPEDSLVSGPAAWTEAVETLRRMADEAQPGTEAARGSDTASDTAQHSCRNCLGIDPDTCLMNPDRSAAEAQQDGAGR